MRQRELLRISGSWSSSFQHLSSSWSLYAYAVGLITSNNALARPTAGRVSRCRLRLSTCQRFAKTLALTRQEYLWP